MHDRDGATAEWSPSQPSKKWTLSASSDLGAGPTRDTLRIAWAAHIGAFEWSHDVTLTFRRPATRDGAMRAFEHTFVRRLARMAQRPLAWFVAAEQSGPGLPWHLHALLCGTGTLSIAQMVRAWGLGHTRVRRYCPTLGAARYVAKAVRDDDAWYDVSRRRPPFRRAA